jgi:hypothetical protein
MRGVRIGWSRDFGIGVPVEPEIVDHLERQLAVFEELGAIVEEATPDFSEADLVFGNTRALDFAAGLGPILERAGDVIKPEVHWNVEKGFALTARDVIETAAARTRLELSVQDFFGRYDLFASPCAQVLPFRRHSPVPRGHCGNGLRDVPGLDAICLPSVRNRPACAQRSGRIQLGRATHRPPARREPLHGYATPPLWPRLRAANGVRRRRPGYRSRSEAAYDCERITLPPRFRASRRMETSTPAAFCAHSEVVMRR